MAVGYCKDCINYDNGWCKKKRTDDHDEYEKWTDSECYEGE